MQMMAGVLACAGDGLPHVNSRQKEMLLSLAMSVWIIPERMNSFCSLAKGNRNRRKENKTIL